MAAPHELPLAHAVRRTMLAATIGLAAMHGPVWATADLTTVAPTCVPQSTDGVDLSLTSTTGGYARAGRNPPRKSFFCPVWNPDDLKTQADWNQVKLQYRDAGGGKVRARVYAKSRTTGVVAEIALVTSLPSASINVVSARLKEKVDFARNGYYIVFELDASTVARQPVEAHMVMLTK